MKILKSILLILIFLSGIKVESQDSKGKAKLAAEIAGPILGASILIGLTYKSYTNYLAKKGLKEQEIQAKAASEKQYNNLKEDFTTAVKSGDQAKISELISKISPQFEKNPTKFMLQIEPSIRDILKAQKTPEKVIDFKIDLARKQIGMNDVLTMANKFVDSEGFLDALDKKSALMQFINETSEITDLSKDYIFDRLYKTKHFQDAFKNDPFNTENLLKSVKQSLNITEPASLSDLNISNLNLENVRGNYFKVDGVLYDKNSGLPVNQLEEIHRIETSGIQIPELRVEGQKSFPVRPEIEPGPGELVSQFKPGMSMSEFESPVSEGGFSHPISFEPSLVRPITHLGTPIEPVTSSYTYHPGEL